METCKGKITKFVTTAVVAGAISALSVEGAVAAEPVKKEDIQLAIAVQSNNNTYMLQMAAGAKMFADSVGLPLKVIVANGDSQQQLSQIQATIATGKKVVMTINPINSADMPAIVRAISQSGGFITSHWNKPKGYNPWDISPAYVAHLTYDGYSSGYWTSKKLFEAMGGKGNFIALKGILDSPPTPQRFAGMEKALKEFPDIKLLDTQVANWDRQKAFDITKTLLTKYPDQIDGIWSQSDSMAGGAFAAVEQAGLVDKVKFTGNDGTDEVVKLIDSQPNFVASYTTEGYYNGALGLAIAYAAATGELDVEKMPHEQRAGNYSQVGIDKSNVKQYLNPPEASAVIAEVNKGLFARLIGPEMD